MTLLPGSLPGSSLYSSRRAENKFFRGRGYQDVNPAAMNSTSRFVALTCVSLGGFFLGRRALAKVAEKPEEAVGQVAEKVGIGSQAQEPLLLLARGATQVGEIFSAWSAEDLSLGLAALSKVSEKQPPPTPGVATAADKDPAFLWLVQRARALAEAAYCKSAAAFSLAAGVAESHVVAAAWEPCRDSFCPAYVVCLDPELGGAVVLVVRGTENVVDALVDAAGVSAPLQRGRYAHGGFLHGARALTEGVRSPLRRAFAAAKRKDAPLLLVGHSLGAAVAALSAALLKDEWPRTFVLGFGCPPCVDAQTARDSRGHVLNFVAGHDVVPRFSVGSLDRLRVRLQELDWREVEALAEGDPDFEKICAGARLVRDWSSKASKVVKQAQGAAGWVQKAGGKLEEMKSGAAVVASRACGAASKGGSADDKERKGEPSEGGDKPGGDKGPSALDEGGPTDKGAKGSGEREDDSEWTQVGVDEAEAGEGGGKGEGGAEARREGRQTVDDSGEGVKGEEDEGSSSKPTSTEEPSPAEEEGGDDDVRIEELSVPGRCFVVWSCPPGSGVHSKTRDHVPQQRSLGAYPTFDDVESQKVDWQLREVGDDDLKDLIVSPWCISDHMPGHVGEGIAHVQLRAPPLVDLNRLFGRS